MSSLPALLPCPIARTNLAQFPYPQNKTLLDNVLVINPLGKGVVTQLYEIIPHLDCPSLSISKALWEEELKL